MKLETRKLKKKFKSTIEQLTKSKKVILIYPLPQAPTNVLYRIKNNNDKKYYKDQNFFKKDKINYDKRIHLSFNKDIINYFNSLNYKNLYKVDFTKTFCPEERCLFYDNENSYFFDSLHPSSYGSKKINSHIFKIINNIENNKN